MEENEQAPVTKKKTPVQCYRKNEMFKSKLAPLECPTCGKSYNSARSLRDHLRIHVPGYKKPKQKTAKELEGQFKFACERCGKRFVRETGLKKHMVAHEVIRSCEACGKISKDSQAHYKHKKKCKAYRKLFPNKYGDKANDQTSKSKGTRWIESTEEYLSVYQHKCQMCQAKFALREHLDKHTECCGEVFGMEIDKQHLKENIRNAEKKARRKHIFLKVIKNDRKKDAIGRERIRAEQIRRIRKVLFRSSSTHVVSCKVKHKYNNLQKGLGKQLKDRKAILKNMKEKVKQRLAKSQKIIEKDTWYKCTFCGALGMAEAIVRHLKSPLHKLKMPLVCGTCTEGFETLNDFRFHQALRSHKINKTSLMIRHTTNVLPDKTKQVLNRYEKDKNTPPSGDAVQMKTDNKLRKDNKDETIVVDQFESKCFCGVVFKDIQKLITHSSISHDLLMALKCKHCASANVFLNILDLWKHLTSHHKRIKRHIYQSDFEEKLLIPVKGQGTNMLVNNMTFKEQSLSGSASVDNKHEAEARVDDKVKQDQSGELTERESQLLAKQEEFVQKTIRKMLQERMGEKVTDGNNRQPERRKRPIRIDKSFMEAKELRAANKRRHEHEHNKEKCHENAAKILQAKQCLRKYKRILGWKCKKSVWGKRLKLNVRNGQTMNKSMFIGNKTVRVGVAAKVSEETKALLSSINSPSQCHLCDKITLKNQAALLSHVKLVHNLTYGYRCRSCEPAIVFTQLQEFYNHRKDVHGKCNLSKSEVEQATVIQMEKSGQASANSKTNSTLSSTSTCVSPGVSNELIVFKTAQAQPDNLTTHNTAKGRLIRPKHDPDFEYGEATVPSKRQKLDKSIQKAVTLLDQHGKAVTIMLRGTPVEMVGVKKTNEKRMSNVKKMPDIKKTPKEEHRCRLCGKCFRLKMMLNQHIKKMHGNKQSSYANIKTFQERPMKRENVKKYVVVRENAMFMNTIYQNGTQAELSGVNSVKTKKKYGSKKESCIDDHSYETRPLFYCTSKNCNFKCKTVSTLKRHMRGQHGMEMDVSTAVPNIDDGDYSWTDGEDDIGSGDSDMADMIDTDDRDYKTEPETDQDETSTLETVKISKKLSHSDLEKDIKKVDSPLEKLGKPVRKPRHHFYYCPFCDEISETYEKIRDHIDNVHAETPESQTSSTGPAAGEDDVVSDHPSASNDESLADKQTKTDTTSTAPDNEETTSQQEKPTITSTGAPVAEAKNPDLTVSTKRFQCDICQQSFKREFTRNIHKLDHTGEFLNVRVCGLCSFSYEKPFHLRRHMKAHRETGSWSCDMCSRQFKTKIELSWHVSKIHGGLSKLAKGTGKKKLLECTLCAVRFPSPRAARRHTKIKHTQLTNFEKSKVIRQADKDGTTNSGNGELARVRPIQRKATHKTAGSAGIPKREKLADPSSTPPEKSFECTLCGLRFVHMKTVRRHTRQKHTDLSITEAHRAIRKIDVKQESMGQLETKDTETIQCKDETPGPETTVTVENIGQVRVKATEQGKARNVLQCEHCPYSTRHDLNLKLHVERVHELDRDTVDTDNPGSDTGVGDGVASDGENAAAFDSTQTANIVKSNMSEKSRKLWQCEHCPYSSRRRFNLKLHVRRVHSDDTDTIDPENPDNPDSDTGKGDSAHSDGEKNVGSGTIKATAKVGKVKPCKTGKPRKQWQCKLCPYYSRKSCYNLKIHVKKIHAADLASVNFDNPETYAEIQYVDDSDLARPFTSKKETVDPDTDAGKGAVKHWKQWQCKLCPYYSRKSRYNLKIHVKKIHAAELASVNFDNPETYAEKQYVDESDLAIPYTGNTREVWGKGLEYKCTIDSCGRVFSLWKFFLEHRKNDHGQLVHFQCSICKNDYSSINSLRIHLSQYHIALDRVPLHIIGSEISKQNSYKTGKNSDISTNNETEILICASCGTTGLDDELKHHHCHQQVPLFYCPCCDNPKSVYSEDREVVREHIRKEHLHLVTPGETNGDVVGSDTVMTSEQRSPTTGWQRFNSGQFDKNMLEMEHTGVPLQRYVCGLCGLSYPRSSAYCKHSQSHREAKYKCNLCPRAFHEKSDFDRHSNTHSGERPFVCDVCGNRYCDLKDCKKHMKMKHEEVYNERYALSRRGAQAEQSLVCDQCGQFFTSFKRLYRHTNTIHGPGKMTELVCGLCPDKTFHTQAMLNKHLQQHSHDEKIKQQQQQQMNNEEIIDPKIQLHEKVKLALKSDTPLDAVYKQLHVYNQNDRDGLPHMCKICSKKFRKVKYMYEHIKQVHANDESKKYQCTECGRGFSRTNAFRIHMRTHTNSRPFKCLLCQKTFKQRGHIKDHLLSHSAHYKTCCGICGKAFKARKARNNHIATHCKIKPFSCPACPQKFSVMADLMDHFSGISHSRGQQKENTLRKFTCPMCTTFQCEVRHDMLRHFDNHTMEKHFHCEKCNARYTKFMDLYYHKEKNNHFVAADLEGVEKYPDQPVGKNRKNDPKIYDQYTLEEIQTMFVYQPDDTELTRNELDGMMNDREAMSVLYDQGHGKVSGGKKGPGQSGAGKALSKRAVTQRDFEDLEYTSSEEEESDVEYESDLLSVAEQLTHMANRNNRSSFTTIDSSQDIFTQPDQLQLDGGFDIGSPWSTPGFVVKQPSQRNNAAQNQSARLNAEINPNIVQTPNFKSISHEETVSATNALLEKNKAKSDFSNIDHLQFSASVKGKVKSPIKPVAAVNHSTNNQSIPNIAISNSKSDISYQIISGNTLDSIGNETIVYIVNGNEDANAIINLIETSGSEIKTTISAKDTNAVYNANDKIDYVTTVSVDDGVYQDNIGLNTGLNMTVPDNRVIPSAAGNRQQSAVNNRNADLLRKSTILSEDNYLTNIEAIEEARKQVIHDAKQDPDYRPDDSSDSEEEDGSDENEVKVKLNTRGFKYRQIKQFGKNNENSGDYQCGLCMKRFGTAKLRNVHAKIHLPDHLQRFQCTECGKGFSRAQGLRTHMSVHTGSRDWHCDICDKSFTQQGHLKTHRLTHGPDKPFKCTQCTWTGITGSLLRRHIKEKHMAEHRMKCQVCNKTFGILRNLQKHAITHLSQSAQDDIVAKTSIIPDSKQGELTEQPESQSNENVEESSPVSKKHMCDFCGMTFTKAYSLKLHIEAKHYEGEDFKCDVCQRGYPTARRLKEHKKLHEQQTIPCDRCGKIFASRHNLKKHIKTQHESKNKKVSYKCMKCKKCFYRKQVFLCHVSVCCPKQAGIIAPLGQ